MHSSRTRVPALAAALATLAAAAGAQSTERRSVPGQDVAIYNIAGDVRAVAGSGSDVSVEITRGGADARRLTVETGEIGDRQTLRVIYPDRSIVYPRMEGRSRTDLRVGDDGRFNDKSGGMDRGDRVTVRGSGDGLEAYADLRVSIPRGKTVAIYLGVGTVNVTNVDGDLRVDVSSASIVTSGTRGRLDLDTGSGSVRVTDAEGELSVDTGSGSVEVANANGRRVNLDTGSGSVTGSGITTDNLRVDTGSGGVELARVSAPDIYVDTGSGEVRLELTSDVQSLKIDTGSGGVELTVPSVLGADITVSTGSGGIQTDIPIQIRRFQRDALSGTIGDGNGRIHIDTGSGGVHLRRPGSVSRER